MMEFVVDYYCMAHGKRPGGRGMWGFSTKRNPVDEDIFWTYGGYGEAKAAARRHFAGESRVYVMT